MNVLLVIRKSIRLVIKIRFTIYIYRMPEAICFVWKSWYTSSFKLLTYMFWICRCSLVLYLYFISLLIIIMIKRGIALKIFINLFIFSSRYIVFWCLFFHISWIICLFKISILKFWLWFSQIIITVPKIKINLSCSNFQIFIVSRIWR
jgi:hypothetical protein